MLVGELEGEVSTDRLRFEAFKEVEKFDFVTVKNPKEGKEWILAQVDKVTKNQEGKTEAEAEVIGYREDGMLKQPRHVVEPDAMVYRADEDVIAETLGLISEGLYLGRLDTNPDISIHLDPEDLYKHIAVLAKTGAGKCVSGDTEVLLADGSLTPIKELIEENTRETVRRTEEEEFVKLDEVAVQSVNPDLEVETANALYGYKKEAEKVVSIETSSGRSITVSKDHPLLCAEETGFRKAENLSEGDRIGVPRTIKSEGEASASISRELVDKSESLKAERIKEQQSYDKVMEAVDSGGSIGEAVESVDTSRSTVENWVYQGYKPGETEHSGLVVSKKGKQIRIPEHGPELAEFLAMLIAEGTEPGYSYYRAIFTNEDERLLDRFTELADNLFNLETSASRENTVYIGSNALREFLQDIGYRTNRKSREKKIPGIIMRSGKEAKRQFLETYFDCEGGMESHEATVSTASRDIANRLSYLLLEFGIFPRIHEKFKQATNSGHSGDTYYELSISGVRNLDRFRQKIGFGTPSKQEKLEEYLDGREYNTNTDTFPVDGDLIRRTREEAGISQRELGNITGLSQMTISRYENENREPSIESLSKVAEALDMEEYQKISDSDILWDEIESVEIQDNPDRYVYDLTVQENHTFVAGFGGVINHNSYATGVMIEELLERDYPVLVIDPHGEYHTLGVENDISEEDANRYEVEPKGYRVEEYSTNTEINQEAEDLSFSSRNLEAKELEQMVPTSLTNSQLEVLYNALKDLKKRDSYTLEDIIDRAMEQDSKAKWNLVNILEIVQDSNMFSDDPTDPEDLVRSGEASIVNLKGVDPEQQEMVVYKLAKELFERRKRGELEPFIMVIEEAHNFVPERNFGKAVCSDVLRTIASEGRKFGLGLGVISQRPARVDKNVLSQCNTQLIMRVTNPNDLNAISRSFEGVTSEVKDFITSLPPGVGLLLGKEYPVMTDVRRRKSRHGGETKELSRGEKETGEDEAELEEPEPAETRASSPEPEEKERGAGRIKSLEPSLSYDKLKEKSGEAEVAYYPVYLVRTAKGSAAVDASRGEIRYSESFSSGLESDILEILKRSERSRGKLMEALDVPLSELEPALETLKEEGAVREEESEYVYDGFPAFQEEAREVQPEDSHTIIDPEITEDEAARIASAEIGSEDVSVEKVYYPYFKSGEQVFDAVRAEEV